MILDNLKGQMDKLEELLPGIESYLTETLANEKLSSDAEELRLYFVERIDILKLPPTRPPRTSVSQLHHDEPIKKQPITETDVPPVDETPQEEARQSKGNVDFAALQRELSRTLLGKSDDDSDGEGKVYDDIEDRGSEGELEENGVYEVPVTSASTDDLGPSSTIFDFQSVDSSDFPESGDTTLTDNQSRHSLTLLDTGTVASYSGGPAPPPPLPPRHHRHSSGDTNTNSLRTSLVLDEPPKLPDRPNLPPRSEIYALSERSTSDKSDRSEKSEDHTDYASDGCHIKVTPNETGTSYESYEDDGGRNSQDVDLLTKMNIKLPMPLNRKKKKRGAFSKSTSSSQWDLHLSFKDLEEVIICGELNLHGKITWNRRLVAVTNRRLLCYKPEKMSKPSLVVQLPGYQTTYNERENRKGFEILLHHPLAENYAFSVELLEWAQSWCEYIQAAADGKDPPGRALRLYRHSGSYLTDLLYRTKSDPRSASSNSIYSSDGSSTSRKDHRDRSSRISLAQRASTFLIKKRAKKMTVIGIPAEVLSEARPRPSTYSSTTTLNRQKNLPMSPSSQSCGSEKTVKKSIPSQESYLNVFSSFNRKRIGKRWCLVRANQFECYPKDDCEICEMSFPLNRCTFRHAKDVTGSETSIMILEKEAEKITVEALKLDSVDDWITVLLRETQTKKVPEGLERYYTEKAYEVPPEDIGGFDYEEDPDDPYSCIKDLSANASATSVTDKEVVEVTEKAESSEAKPTNIADMYSPVLWETKRNSSKSSLKKEGAKVSRSSVTSDEGQGSTPDVQPIKQLYSGAVTDSGYTTATSPTSANQNSIGETRPESLVTSPDQQNSLDSLLKSWDVKAKILNLEKEKTKEEHKHSKLQENCNDETLVAGVKTKVIAFEQKSTIDTSPTPTPPKRKRSQSKNKNLPPSSSPKILKPVSLDFTYSSANSDSVETLKDIDQLSNLQSKDLHSRETNSVSSSQEAVNYKPTLPLREDSEASLCDPDSCDTDSYLASPAGSDSCITDSSDFVPTSEHETPTNSDTENLPKNHFTDKYRNSSEKSQGDQSNGFSLKEDAEHRDSREGTTERSSRESSTEPSTSCSSWDSSQEANMYNFGFDSSSETNADEPDDLNSDGDEVFSGKNKTTSVSSENSLNGDVLLLSNKMLPEDFLETSGHFEKDPDYLITGDLSSRHDWPEQLDILRRKLVDLKKNRIQARDKKLRARSETELENTEELFKRLDAACKETNQRISKIEGMINLNQGEELSLSSEA